MSVDVGVVVSIGDVDRSGPVAVVTLLFSCVLIVVSLSVEARK